MKIKQHLAKEVSIDGSGGVYIANHREKAVVLFSADPGATAENTAKIKFINWDLIQCRNKTRLGRFLALLPTVWRISK